ncbi:unnamed protein product [Cuscuta epithymum]|uniref:Transposase-associated domain-containing protein n=1 Tax=Cuscuta epithymum TaxID=186058 RepID=A0AAV0G071_9ASTE|nr:unnamed protein product [Cuscuta epithymum]CAH9141295.1 unnamed protein product [Cuscuta epithymum]
MSFTNRNWMYQRKDEGGYLTQVFIKGVDIFVNFAKSKPDFMDGNKIRCPCTKCHNRQYQEVDTLKLHLVKHGFVPNYFFWNRQGETLSDNSPTRDHAFENQNFGFEDMPSCSYRQMVMDAAGPDFIPTRIMDEEPNAEDKKFFDMLEATDKPLWPGCEKLSQLSIVSRLLNIKSEFRLSEQCFDAICQLFKDALPEDNNMVDSFYDMKKLVHGLGLPVEKIDCCSSGCMLYWGENKDLTECKICQHPRYKTSMDSSKQSRVPNKRMHYLPLTPRLKRLYASQKTAPFMRWHDEEHGHDIGEMCHPSDSEAWRDFNVSHPSFASENRNVRLGLCTDGFQPFGQSGQQYSCWPIMVTPYNLPPSMCMKDPYMFLSVIVPGPDNPKHKLDVFLQPLIAELKNLWEEGVLTYDVSLKQNFQMRAALLWTISDFPAYSMLSGWGTSGRTACPHCMEHSQAFYLPNGKKMSWFDNHRKFLPLDHSFRRNKSKFTRNRVEMGPPPPIKSGSQILQEIDEFGLLNVIEDDAEEVNKECSNICGWRKRSIFWDLPYWKTNVIRHNLDIMHIEKNFFENVFNTVMNIKGKTKDNVQAREDMKLFCNRKELQKNPLTDKYPKACYSLDNDQKKVICEWVKSVKFPDGYVSNLGRCVDMKKHKLFGMKSHDCHVFMQRLMPIAFREMLPVKVWEALTELSLFFKNLSATTIKVDDMARLEAEIPIILCKLESLLVPGFFNSMEHLPVHLPYEAKISGPAQYRWMYRFER